MANTTESIITELGYRLAQDISWAVEQLTALQGEEPEPQPEPEPTPEPQPQPDPEPEPNPEPEPTPEPEPQPTPASGPPLSWDAVQGTHASNPIAIRVGNTVENVSITETGQLASVQFLGSGTLRNSRIKSREGIRVSNGNVLIEGTWVEVRGSGNDHADGLQVYGPGGTGLITVRNSTFRTHPESATAGYFSADNWKGDHVFENVVFWGGPYGLRINGDGGASISLKNVYFVEPFLYGAFESSPVNGKRPRIAHWENVCLAEIKDGKLVVLETAPRPW